MPMRFVFPFEEGSADQKDLLGGKGANLSEMMKLGIPVPHGFIITTACCNAFLARGNVFPEGVEDTVEKAVEELEKKTGKQFGDDENPLLVSVRSGAKISMPGMMDTVLNLGMNDKAEEGLAKKTGNARFAADTHRRFVQMFSNVVLEVPHHLFEAALAQKKREKNITADTDFSAEDLHDLVKIFRDIAEKHTGNLFPKNAKEQLFSAIRAVFSSWNSSRAKKYREIHHIPDHLGTAVCVQSMVFGNTGNTSGTGVCFTRNPSTGENAFYGDYLLNAQGEDVVAGIRTPLEITHLAHDLPEVYAELFALQKKLELHFKDMQDIEFTIENGKLFLLQTRTGKRTAMSAVRIAVDMVAEKILTKEEAILRLDPKSLDALLYPSLDPKAKKEVLTKGISASPGAASGKVVFSAEHAVEWTEKGEKVLLVRHETSPEDIHGMHVSEGILTACGGKASHAAVVARGMGVPCVSGAVEVVVNEKEKKISVHGTVVHEGDMITIDGGTGEVMLGKIATRPAELSAEFEVVLSWADELKRLQVRANADTPHDAAVARKFGAEGIGLCRTEHMFFEEDRIHFVRKMILAHSDAERDEALESLLPFQQTDFEGIFTEMDSLPVTIRFLDPPLHEFLPHKNHEIEDLAHDFGLSFEEVKDRVTNLSEVNPMLGHRGCRLLITLPGLLEMQTKAIFEAAMAVKKRGISVFPEIMIPLVGVPRELAFCREKIEETAEAIFHTFGERIPFLVGTMIELPRACAEADQIAEFADFFSFGTNDLTQMSFGFSRDDVARFLPEYIARGFLENDPFERIDEEGVGELIKIGVERGRKQKTDLKISVCGEHGGDPESIDFFHRSGFTLVSCSPFRVPIARLAAAQAAIKRKNIR
ncbi:MAG: pyruvate, phosphate dikinase [Candidatus Peregrinibacteria bacterium]